MKKTILFYIIALIAISLFIPSAYYIGYYKGKSNGIEITKRKEELKYMRLSIHYLDSLQDTYKGNKLILDSLKEQMMQQGIEAQKINRKLVEKFKL